MESYKEKYEQALEVAKETYDKQPMYRDWLEKMFPEFKESEDEKVRKEILSYLKTRKGYTEAIKEPWIAWLENIPYTIDHEKREGFHLGYRAGFEKQGEKSVKWNENTDGNKPQKNHSVLMKTTHGITEGEWKGNESWIQYRWSSSIKDSDVLFWIELSDIEKQGEQKPIIDIEIPFGAKDSELQEATYYIPKGYHAKIEGDKVTIKKGEQKPADKVEPKFHEGEWITNGGYTWKIVEVKPLDYMLLSQDDNIVDDTISHVDEQFHSFTIQDAKEGDVLYINNTLSESIMIYKSFNNGVTNKYASYNKFGFEGENYLTLNDGYIIPATKEQRDLLSQKMHEAGYMWDSESKQLLSLKAEPSGEQKPAWSEEEERYIRQLESMVKERWALAEKAQDEEVIKNMSDLAFFLKTLNPNKKPADDDMKTLLRTEYEKGRADAIAEMQMEWNEEDEPQKELAESYLAKFDKKFPILPTLKGKQLADYKNFLNKCQQIFGLKYWGIRPIQAKLFEKLSLLWAAWGAEHLQGLGQTDGDIDNEISMWSEETDDDAWMNDIISKVENNLQLNKMEIDRLKSLRFQNRWKPSERQLACLQDAVEHYHLMGSPATTLTEILKQLRKLKEGKV